MSCVVCVVSSCKGLVYINCPRTLNFLFQTFIVGHVYGLDSLHVLTGFEFGLPYVRYLSIRYNTNSKIPNQ